MSNECKFIDADDHHSKENIKKMSNGISLNDNDRIPWLKSLNKIALQHENDNIDCIIACSALTNKYRNILKNNLNHIIFYTFNCI